MSKMPRTPYKEPDSSSTKWVILFVVVSLLVHVLIIAAIISITVFMPGFTPEKLDPTIDVTLVPPPPPPVVPQKPLFVPTPFQPNAPHKIQKVESANDHELTSKSTVSRDPNSFMPDITGNEHQTALNNTPNVKAPEKPEVSSTPPTPKQDKPEKPTPPQPPQPEQPPQPKTTPPVLHPTPPKPTPPTPPKPEPQLDPNGLPVLPDINAPTLAQVHPEMASPPAAVAPSTPQLQTSVHGALGHPGDNSPAAMATELGKYKQYVRSVVGSYWYPDIDAHFGIIPVGMVHIQFTIHADGKITDVTILEGDSLEQLKVISRHALVAPAPYKPFSDELIKQIGDSYTDDFTFSVY